MAKGIEMNGQLRGKRGGVVYYRAEGQQVSRARNFNPKNPQTMPQMMQRLFLANASKAAVGFKEIIDHSFEGVAYGAKSVRHFESKAQLVLKAATPTEFDHTQLTPCVPLDAMGFPVAKFMVSSGSLPSAKCIINQNPTNGCVDTVMGEINDGTQTLASARVGNIFACFGIELGSQITIVTTRGQDSVGGAGTDYIFEDNVLNPVIRLNFKENTSAELAFDNEGYIREAVLDTDKSNNWDLLHFAVTEDGISFNIPDVTCNSMAIIISRYESGAWRRSTEFLTIAATTAEAIGVDTLKDWGWNDLDLIKESVQKGKNIQEEYFLNKEDN